MKRMEQIISTLILISAAVSFCSCKDSSGEDVITVPADDKTVVTQEAAETETTEPEYKPKLPDDLDYNEKEFSVYSYDDANETWKDVDFSATEENGDLLNDAVYRRMVNTENILNVKIKNCPVAEGCGGFNNLKKSVTANDALYNMAMLNPHSVSSASQKGYIIDLHTIEQLDLGAPWWDQNCIEQSSILNKLFMITGDIETMYKKSIGVIMFNKQMREDYQLPDLYKMVDDKKWTIGQLDQMCRDVSEDVNGDGKFGLEDKYGIIYYCDLMSLGLIGAGVNFVTKNADDVPELTFFNEHTVNAFETYAEALYNEKSAISWSQRHIFNDDTIPIFEDDRSLFMFNEFHSIENLRSMDTDFGILPIPLYDENQENYRHIINPHVAATVTIPADVPVEEYEFTAAVMDVMGWQSKKILTPAYNETYLKVKGTRDNDSAKILDIIFSTLTYDLGYLCDWGGIGGMPLGMANGFKTDLASAYAKKEGPAIKAIQKALDNYNELG